MTEPAGAWSADEHGVYRVKDVSGVWHVITNAMTPLQRQIAQRLADLGSTLDPTFNRDTYMAEVMRLYAASAGPAESSAPSHVPPCSSASSLEPPTNEVA